MGKIQRTGRTRRLTWTTAEWRGTPAPARRGQRGSQTPRNACARSGTAAEGGRRCTRWANPTRTRSGTRCTPAERCGRWQRLCLGGWQAAQQRRNPHGMHMRRTRLRRKRALSHVALTWRGCHRVKHSLDVLARVDNRGHACAQRRQLLQTEVPQQRVWGLTRSSLVLGIGVHKGHLDDTGTQRTRIHERTSIA